MTDLLLVPLYYSNRIDRRIPVATPGMEFIHLAQAVQDAYNDLKRDANQDSRQVTHPLKLKDKFFIIQI